MVTRPGIEIIKNAPLPLPRMHGARCGVHPIYPFSLMEVGDSFDHPRDRGSMSNGQDKRRNRILAAARNWSKRNQPSWQFTTRILDENTVRCWRIA